MKAVTQFLNWWNLAVGALAIGALLLFSAIETPAQPYLIGTVVLMVIVNFVHNVRGRLAEQKKELNPRRDASSHGNFDKDDASD